MGTKRRWPNIAATIRLIVGILGFNRAASFHIDMAGPGCLGKFVCREQFAIGAVENIEEPILRRLHNHFAGLALQFQICQN